MLQYVEAQGMRRIFSRLFRRKLLDAALSKELGFHLYAHQRRPA